MNLRTVISLTLLILFVPAALLAETSISANSRISAVTVFADRAQVTRNAAVFLKKGSNFVLFENLPQLMVDDSIRVEGKGAGRAGVAGITLKKVFLEKVQEKRVRELEEEIASLTRKIESIDAKRKALSAQRAFIDSIRVGWSERISKELAAGKPTTTELNEALKFVGENVGKVEEQQNDAEAAKKPLQDRIAALKQELEQSRTEQMKEVRAVQVAVDADRDMTFNLDLSYLVHQARWEPSYDVRLAPDGKEAELVYRAQVWQRTGEDWPGVKLSLSTAAPEVGGGAPELTPWHISLWEPPVITPYPVRTYKAAPAPAAPAPQAEGRVLGAAPDQVEQAIPVIAGVTEGQTSVLFNVPTPADVPTDGTRSGSIVATRRVPVTLEYVTVPKLSQRVYLKSEVVNKTPYPLLAGEANIFNDAVFVGKAELKTVASGEDFTLFFGADDQVKVKREVAKVNKKGGLIGSNSISYHVTMELENFKKRSVAVSVLDQKPLPGNAEIKVEVEDASPKPAETKDDGTIIWKLDLAPGEKKKVSYDILVDYPKGRRLVGD